MYSEWATQATLRCPNARDVLQTKGRAQPPKGRFGAWGGGVTHLGTAYENVLLVPRASFNFHMPFQDNCSGTSRSENPYGAERGSSGSGHLRGSLGFGGR